MQLVIWFGIRNGSWHVNNLVSVVALWLCDAVMVKNWSSGSSSSVIIIIIVPVCIIVCYCQIYWLLTLPFSALVYLAIGPTVLKTFCDPACYEVTLEQLAKYRNIESNCNVRLVG